MRTVTITVEAKQEHLEEVGSTFRLNGNGAPPYPLTDNAIAMIEAIRRRENGGEILRIIEPLLLGACHHADVELILGLLCSSGIVAGGELDTMDNFRTRTIEMRFAFALGDSETAHTQTTSDNPLPETITPEPQLKRRKLRS